MLIGKHLVLKLELWVMKYLVLGVWQGTEQLTLNCQRLEFIYKVWQQNKQCNITYCNDRSSMKLLVWGGGQTNIADWNLQ